MDCLGAMCDELCNNSRVELNEAVRGRLIGSKSWNRGVGFLKPMWTVRDYPRAVWGAMVQNCAMNDALTCMRPEITVKFGFTK